MHYIEWEGGESTLLLVHGLTDNARMFDTYPWAESFMPRYRLIAPDLRGRGESDKAEGPYGIKVHAKDRDAYLDSWRGNPLFQRMCNKRYESYLETGLSGVIR